MAEATKLNGLVRTSSPAPQPSARTPRCSAGGAAGDRDRVLDPQPLGEGPLEALAHRPEREASRAQHLERQLLLALAEVGPGQRDRLVVGCGAGSSTCGWKAYSSESTSASQEASMMFSETPMVPHSRSPSEESSRTRVTASVPWVSSRIRTL